MQVRTTGPSRLARSSDQLTLLDKIAGVDLDRIQVPIVGSKSKVMGNDEQIPKTRLLVQPRLLDDAVRRSVHGRTLRRPEIDPAMVFALTADRVLAETKRARHSLIFHRMAAGHHLQHRQFLEGALAGGIQPLPHVGPRIGAKADHYFDVSQLAVHQCQFLAH